MKRPPLNLGLLLLLTLGEVMNQVVETHSLDLQVETAKQVSFITALSVSLALLTHRS